MKKEICIRHISAARARKRHEAEVNTTWDSKFGGNSRIYDIRSFFRRRGALDVLVSLHDQRQCPSE
jgi:hypothetical protein